MSAVYYRLALATTIHRRHTADYFGISKQLETCADIGAVVALQH